MAQPRSDISLLVDGSALYLASRQVDAARTLDYRALENSLRQRVGARTFEPAVLWTSFDATNEGQAKFLEFIERELRWTVDAVPVQDAVAHPKGTATEPTSIRFGERIAYAIGRLAASGNSSIVVVSDQYSLSAPMIDVVKRGGQVWLSFFGSQLEVRYHRLIRSLPPDPKPDYSRLLSQPDAASLEQQKGRLRFIDLDDMASEIWGSGRRASPNGPDSGRGFARIP
ncbi:MAG: hypothetical protein IPJ77_13545 [Planctomycetes bacterium]|nr:hypothetical protein [Planctomycetota bacterium]